MTTRGEHLNATVLTAQRMLWETHPWSIHGIDGRSELMKRQGIRRRGGRNLDLFPGRAGRKAPKTPCFKSSTPHSIFPSLPLKKHPTFPLSNPYSVSHLTFPVFQFSPKTQNTYHPPCYHTLWPALPHIPPVAVPNSTHSTPAASS